MRARCCSLSLHLPRTIFGEMLSLVSPRWLNSPSRLPLRSQLLNPSPLLLRYNRQNRLQRRSLPLLRPPCSRPNRHLLRSLRLLRLPCSRPNRLQRRSLRLLQLPYSKLNRLLPRSRLLNRLQNPSRSPLPQLKRLPQLLPPLPRPLLTPE